MRKILWIVLCCLSSLYIEAKSLSYFETKNFLIEIQNNCEEGNITCDDVSYKGIRKSDGETLSLKGRTLNRNCQSSTCDFYGYEFKNGNYTYTIWGKYPEALIVAKNNKVLLQENGKFSNNNPLEKDNNKYQKSINNEVGQYLGDSNIGDKKFVEKVNSSCTIKNLYHRTNKQADQDNKQCILSKIKFPYDVLSNIGNIYPSYSINQDKKVYLQPLNDINIFLVKTKQQFTDSGYNINVTLFTEKNHQIIDKLIIYQEENDADSFVNNRQYYFIGNFISIMKVSTVEEGTILNYWKKYTINSDGKISLVDSYDCDLKTNICK